MNIDINQYQQLLTISKELLIQADIDHVLTISMDRLIEISGAERGIIILFDDTNGLLAIDSSNGRIYFRYKGS